MHHLQPKKVIMVPEWTMTLLQREGCKLSDILDLGGVIGDKLSASELATILLLNTDDTVKDTTRSWVLPYYQYIFSVDPNSFEDPGWSVLPVSEQYCALKQIWSQTQEGQELCKGYEKLFPVIRNLFEQRFFIDRGFLIRGDEYNFSGEKPYRFLDSDQAIFVIIKPQAFAFGPRDGALTEYEISLKKSIVRDLCEVLYTYRANTHNQVRSIDCKYIESLLV